MRKWAVSGSFAVILFLFFVLFDFKTSPLESSSQESNEKAMPETGLDLASDPAHPDISYGNEIIPYSPTKESESMPNSDVSSNDVEADPSRTEVNLPTDLELNPLDQIDTSRALALVDIAQYLADMNFYEEGIPWADDAIRLDPGLPEAHLVSGILNFNLRNRNEAIAAFERTIELDPLNFKAHLYLGIIYSGNKNPSLAVEYFSKAIKIANSPEEISTAFTHRALAFALMERYEECFADLDDALFLNPENGLAILVRGTVNKALEQRQATSEAEGIPGVSEGFTE